MENTKFYAYEELTDYGPGPLVFNLHSAAKQNNAFRRAVWTGNHMQMTLMNITDEIGLEMHPNLDQFLRIEEGGGLVKMGLDKNNLNHQMNVHAGSAIFIPAGTWHNLINTERYPIKLYSIYAPVQHPHGTVHNTRADAERAENENH